MHRYQTILRFFPAIVCFVVVLLGLENMAFAQQNGYVPLAGIPGVTQGETCLVSYLNALFLLTISVGAMIAVIKIAIAGITYMLSEVVTQKQSARNDITGALLGLVILFATWVVLYEIYPGLVSLNVFASDQCEQIDNNDDSDAQSEANVPLNVFGGAGAEVPECAADEQIVRIGDAFYCESALGAFGGPGEEIPDCQEGHRRVYNGSTWSCQVQSVTERVEEELNEEIGAYLEENNARIAIDENGEAMVYEFTEDMPLSERATIRENWAAECESQEGRVFETIEIVGQGLRDICTVPEG